MKTAILLLMLLITPSGAGPIQNPLYVGMIPLLANPTEYNGRTISTIAFLRLEPEGDALYLSPEDFDNEVAWDRLRIERTADMTRRVTTLNMKYVRVVGTFISKGIGHGDLAGRLTDVTTCEFWSDPKNPRAYRLRDELRK